MDEPSQISQTLSIVQAACVGITAGQSQRLANALHTLFGMKMRCSQMLAGFGHLLHPFNHKMPAARSGAPAYGKL
jgi:hypothetical protein